jgi:hypothetical protein
MQLLEIIGYGPKTFGTDKNSGRNSENIGEFSVEDAKFHPKRPYRPRTSPGRKGGGWGMGGTSAVFSQKKNVFLRKSCVFTCLGREAPQEIGRSRLWSLKMVLDALHPNCASTESNAQLLQRSSRKRVLNK